MDLLENLKKIEEEAELALAGADSLEKLEELRIVFLGKKGKITDVLKQMGKISPEERPVIGQEANKLKDRLNELLGARKEELADVVRKKRLEEERMRYYPARYRGFRRPGPSFEEGNQGD